MIATKIEPIDHDLIVSLLSGLSPAEQSAALAEFAEEQLADAEQTNAAALGTKPTHETIVDGNPGTSVESVKPNGTIVFEFDLVNPAIEWISQQLQTHSPVKTGWYKRNHALFVDGGADSFCQPVPDGAKELVFVSLVPYARRLEHGWSKQAPDGVYQVVASLARARFGNIMNISFTYRQVDDLEESQAEQAARRHSPRSMNQPAIVIEL